MKTKPTILTISGDGRDEVFVTLRLPTEVEPDQPRASFMMPLSADLREGLRADLILDTRGPRTLGFELWLADVLEPYEFAALCDRFRITGTWVEVWFREAEVDRWEDIRLGENVIDRMQVGLECSEGYVVCIRVSQPGIDPSHYELLCRYEVKEDVPLVP